MDGYTLDPEIQPSQLLPRFLVKTEVDTEASKDKSYRVYRDVEYIELTFDNGASVLYKSLERYPEWKERYPKMYDRFAKTRESRPIGFPLEKFFSSEPAKVKNYEFFSIYTVEQLSALSDANIQNLGIGATEDRKAAQKFLEARKSGAIDAQVVELETLKESLKTTQDENIKLQRELKALLQEKLKGAKQ